MEVSAWHVVTGVISIALTVLIPLIVNLVNRISANAKDLSDHKTHVAENYATKSDVRDMTERLERHMDKQFEQLRTAIKDKAA